MTDSRAGFVTEYVSNVLSAKRRTELSLVSALRTTTGSYTAAEVAGTRRNCMPNGLPNGLVPIRDVANAPLAANV